MLLFAFIFVRLGMWQLDKAQLMQEIAKPQKERATVELLAIAKPNEPLSTSAMNRIVTIRGSYLDNLRAPNQVDANGRVSTWVVGVLQVAGSGKIAVVRGSEPFTEAGRSGTGTEAEKVEVVGRLMPSQINNKFGEVETGVLPRIDSALLLTEYGSDFFDGFVIARSENPDSGAQLVPSPIPQVKVAGFYWQHISYVIVWWLMALLALALPFLRSRSAER